MTPKKVLIIIGVLVLAAAVVGANLYFKRDTGVTVNAEAIRARDLEAIVSASGKIQPKRQVNVSANTTTWAGRQARTSIGRASRQRSLRSSATSTTSIG